ncbi:MAG: NUDIX domain-containing protein [Phycisphaerales bacterium]|nr:NUDIX domain-containing protein [Phycisphaerales bacterium]
MLRRPATLSYMAEPYVPPGGMMDEVDRRWAACCARNPAYFDGRVCHVIGVHRNGYGSAVLHVADCAYRFFAVQDETFDLGVRALGVKGLTSTNDADHGDHADDAEGAVGAWLLGRRSATVGSYAGQWEFAPGGSVEPDRAPAQVVVSELHEETGLVPLAPPTEIALVFDPVLRCWELIYRLRVNRAHAEAPTDEYSERRWCRLDDLPEPLTPLARQLIPIAHGL